MRTAWDENSSRTRISADSPTDVKRGRRANRIAGNKKISSCYGNNIWPRISSGMVIGNLFCIVAYNNWSYQRLAFLEQLKGEANICDMDNFVTTTHSVVL